MVYRVRRSKRKLLKTVALATLVAVLLSACQTNQGPSAENLSAVLDGDIDASGFMQDDSLRARFLPPIGNNKPIRGELSVGLDLEIAIFALDPQTRVASGAALGPDLASGAGITASANGKYSADWNVAQTAAAPASGEYVRVEIRLAGDGSGPACNEPTGACIGYIDARIVATGGNSNGRGRSNRAETDAASSEGFLAVPDHKLVTISFKVIAAGSVPTSIGELETLAGSGNFDETAGNCTSSEFQRPAQGLQAVGAGLQAVGAGLQAVGAAGGLFLAEGLEDAELVTTNAEVAAQVMAGLLSGHHYGNHFRRNVAMLIVDDFGGTFNLPKSVRKDGAGDLTDLEALVAAGDLSHGALVFHQARELAAAALHHPGWTYSNPHLAGAPYVKYPKGYGHLLIQAVDASGLDTEVLEERIRQALHSMSWKGFEHVVVNMSFAIVPCAVTDDFATSASTSDIDTFEQYLAALLEVNEIGYEHRDELGNLLSTPLDLLDDPFFAYLACPLPVDGHSRCDGASGYWGHPVLKSVVHVAASGNFGNEYALYPAALETVVSVGSLDVAAGGYAAGRSGFSNHSTVLAPGAFFHLSNQASTLVYAGTSFAAPVASLYTALDLMSKYPVCDPGSLRTSPVQGHAMATVELSGLPLLPQFAASGLDAVTEYCQAE